MSYLDQITVGSTTYDIKDASAIPAPASATTDSILVYNGTSWVADKCMYIASYGSSTYAEILSAYQNNRVIYCRASSNTNPGTGSQNRLAFLAYVDDMVTPTEFEFQYYRSVATHSNTQQGDQVFVYKLNSSTGWSVTKREAYTKIVANTGLSGTYSNGTLTIKSTQIGLPSVSSSDDGKVLRVVSGEWAAATLSNANGVSF